MTFLNLSLVCTQSSASCGVTWANLDGFTGIFDSGKRVFAIAATSSIGSCTCCVVVAVDAQVLGLIPPLFMSKAILRFVSTLKSSFVGNVIGSMAVAMLFSGSAVTKRITVIFLICSKYNDIGARHASADSTIVFVA